jgi:3-dehydroquinate dehydratase/shikimate dehydrogenase
MTYLTVPITGENLPQAIKQASRACEKSAQMLELRTDFLKNLTPDLVQQLIESLRKEISPSIPLIITCRDEKQGGKNGYPEQLRLNVLETAIISDAEFVDCEYDNYCKNIFKERIDQALTKAGKCRLILSAHNFQSKFENLQDLTENIKKCGKNIIPKLVYQAQHINDCFEGFDLLLENSNTDIILLCMGKAGVISRILAGKFGAMVSFASLDNQTASAPGQLTIDELRKIYCFEAINRETEIYGIIASPVGHSMSPLVHNSCFENAKINSVYLPFLVEGSHQQFDLFMDNVLQRDSLGFSGFSVTIPHKQNALEYVKSKSGEIENLTCKIGVTNTLIISKENVLFAYNTDYSGAISAIMDGMGIDKSGFEDMKVSVLGAGGVARAIVAGLTDSNAEVKIYNRTVKKAEKLAKEFGCEFAPLDKLAQIDADLVINCTSLGMSPNIDTTALPAEYIKSSMTVFDTVYNPLETLLLKNARKKGAKTIDGLTMFVNQAAEQFELFTDKKADKEFMRKLVFDCLKNN